MIRTIFSTHFGAYVLCYYTGIIKDLNITEFLSKILLFPEDCASSSLSQDPSNKKTIY